MRIFPRFVIVLQQNRLQATRDAFSTQEAVTLHNLLLLARSLGQRFTMSRALAAAVALQNVAAALRNLLLEQKWCRSRTRASAKTALSKEFLLPWRTQAAALHNLLRQNSFQATQDALAPESAVPISIVRKTEKHYCCSLSGHTTMPSRNGVSCGRRALSLTALTDKPSMTNLLSLAMLQFCKAELAQTIACT